MFADRRRPGESLELHDLENFIHSHISELQSIAVDSGDHLQ